MDSNRSVSLGCGTLILIILIVVIFGNMANKEVQQEVQQLNGRLDRMEALLEAQAATLDGLRAAVEALAGRQGENSSLHDDAPAS